MTTASNTTEIISPVSGTLTEAIANDSCSPSTQIPDLSQRLTVNALVYLAGNLGEKRALRGSAPGWRRHRTKLELRAHHEAAHGAIGHALNQFIHRLTVVEDQAIKMNGGAIAGGQAWLSFTPEAPVYERGERHAYCDLHHAVKNAAVLALNEPGSYSWKLTLRVARRLRTQAEALVEMCWYPLIVPLAEKLLTAGTLERREIENIAKPETRGCYLRLL